MSRLHFTFAIAALSWRFELENQEYIVSGFMPFINPIPLTWS
jgi:hypothetical protein